MTYNDSFIRNDLHAEGIATDTCAALWKAARGITASTRVRLEAPPFLQGMAITVTATPTRDDHGAPAFTVRVDLVPSNVNPAFDPLHVSYRTSATNEAEFAAIVQPAILAMLKDADRRVPSQTFADLVWRAGLANTSHRLHPRWKLEYPAKCMEIGARPIYAVQTPEQANALIAWLTEWAKAHNLAIPDVSYIEGWGILPPHVVDDPFTLPMPDEPMSDATLFSLDSAHTVN